MPTPFWNDERDKNLLLLLLGPDPSITRARAAEVAQTMGSSGDSVRWVFFEYYQIILRAQSAVFGLLSSNLIKTRTAPALVYHSAFSDSVHSCTYLPKTARHISDHDGSIFLGRC